MSEYSLGKELWHLPGSDNCIPEGWKVGYSLRPSVCTRKRGHLQIRSPELDFVLRVHNRVSPDSAPEHLVEGNNYVETPCTCAAGLCHAMEHRHRLLPKQTVVNGEVVTEKPRPFRIAPRHLKGYTVEQKKLGQRLWSVIKNSGRAPKTHLEKARTHSGTKRRHYEKCATELEVHPLTSAERGRVFHDGSVKWGELSARPRALLVQSVRAKGVGEVKQGELLRAPILVEGVYRDLEEDALHKYMHSRGHHYVASGMSLHKRARKIREMVSPGDVVLSIDLASFDGSIGETGVVERNDFLENAEKLFGEDRQLRVVIETQNRCTVQAGPLRAQLYGNRGSGTAGTSTGNKKIVLAALFYSLGPAARGHNAVKLFCDGDDTLIIVPREFQGDRWYRSWCRRMTELGLEMKLEQVLVDTPENPVTDDIRFCRAGIVETSRGPFLCKIPTDALKVATNFRRHFRGSRFRDYCQTLSVSYKGTFGDVPVLCELSGLFDIGGRVDRGLLESSGLEYMMGKTCTEAGQISYKHRVSYWRTWGVTPEMQLQCEQALRELRDRLRPLLLAANF